MSDDGAITSAKVRQRPASKVLEGDQKKKAPADGKPEALQEIIDEEKEAKVQEKTEELAPQPEEEKFLVKMERINASWSTRNGVVFTREHPFQLVDDVEMDELLDMGGFRRADPREVVKFYEQS